LAIKDRRANCDVSATRLLEQDLEGCFFDFDQFTVRRAGAAFSQAKDVDHAFRGVSHFLELECSMKKLICGAFAAALLGSAALPALAADLPSVKSAPVYAPIDDSFDPFLIRVRALGVLPNGSGSTLLGASIYGAKLTDNVVPEVDLTYFFTKHIAVAQFNLNVDFAKHVGK
jgi:uncharacterized protein YjbI with pentapeptide repeats